MNNKEWTYNVEVDGRDIRVIRVNNDVNGNPRYVVHYLALGLDDYKSIAGTGFSKYRGKEFGGCYVFTSYSLEDTLRYGIADIQRLYPSLVA